ncbi:hypothetical protein TWF106_006205 [Orbilia oligospora]|uniref:NmrA-like domain-containing protein n=1 Tax=Orbilia oligospora TaxID=2813651 RepID=A0A6G1M955_ORBOL|nr:hypothetical protein TWF679_002138 [Orbilia oligospora]KAF3228682.1 hypothetical protein TWF106_006205 [Orbilia oligospora]KAF3250332.1 hypothetical protein TWF192_005351 [Orbilia oligospora]
MVNVTIAGGSGQVSQEIIDALIESDKHHITILSRKNTPPRPTISPQISWKTVDYSNKDSLTKALGGAHTLLSFIQILSDPDQASQKNLIDAAIAAGVKRFAPSEYGSKGTVNMPWWYGKEKVREYLEEVNSKEQVLEYTLFQPGLFLDYLAFPHKTSKHVDPLQTIFDFQNRRAIVVNGHEDSIMTFTTVKDLATIVTKAVEYEGKWPSVGGIMGNKVTFSELLEIGHRVRGRPFSVDYVSVEDLEAGDLNTSWGLEAVHHSVANDQASAMLKAVSIGILLSSTKGAWDISNNWNEIFPDYTFHAIKDFLTTVWTDKP